MAGPLAFERLRRRQRLADAAPDSPPDTRPGWLAALARHKYTAWPWLLLPAAGFLLGGSLLLMQSIVRHKGQLQALTDLSERLEAVGRGIRGLERDLAANAAGDAWSAALAAKAEQYQQLTAPIDTSDPILRPVAPRLEAVAEIVARLTGPEPPRAAGAAEAAFRPQPQQDLPAAVRAAEDEIAAADRYCRNELNRTILALSSRWRSLFLVAVVSGALAALFAVALRFYQADALRQEQAGEAMRLKERRIYEVVGSAPVVLFALDGQGVFTVSEGRGLDQLGLKPGAAVGRSVFDLYRDSPEVLANVRRALSGETFDAVVAAGDTVFETYYRPLSGRDGRVEGVIGVAIDITERRRTEAALRQSREQLLQAQKMEAVGRLAGGVAHDFSNLLTSISGFATFARDALPAGHRAHEHLDEVLKAAARGAALTQQLLAFARRRAVQPAVTDLNALVAGVQKMLEMLLGEDVELVADLAEGLWPVRVDPAQWEQVLVNLAVNARDAMEGGGGLRISTANVTLAAEDPRRPHELPAGDYVLLAVQDTGRGMDDDVKAHLFEPFFTTKEPGKGTGLGLATCYGIVRQSGGAIAMDSAVGRGTTARILLPRAAAAPHEAQRPAPGSALPGGRETVLLVEDDLLVRSMAVRTLREHGYRVLEAANGEEALALSGSDAEPIHLLVTDVVMPLCDGRQLALRLAAQRPDLPVLFVTGHGESAAARAAAGARLEKPFTPQDLLLRVREVLDGRGPAPGALERADRPPAGPG